MSITITTFSGRYRLDRVLSIPVRDCDTGNTTEAGTGQFVDFIVNDSATYLMGHSRPVEANRGALHITTRSAYAYNHAYIAAVFRNDLPVDPIPQVSIIHDPVGAPDRFLIEMNWQASQTGTDVTANMIAAAIQAHPEANAALQVTIDWNGDRPVDSQGIEFATDWLPPLEPSYSALTHIDDVARIPLALKKENGTLQVWARGDTVTEPRVTFVGTNILLEIPGDMTVAELYVVLLDENRLLELHEWIYPRFPLGDTNATVANETIHVLEFPWRLRAYSDYSDASLVLVPAAPGVTTIAVNVVGHQTTVTVPTDDEQKPTLQEMVDAINIPEVNAFMRVCIPTGWESTLLVHLSEQTTLDLASTAT